MEAEVEGEKSLKQTVCSQKKKNIQEYVHDTHTKSFLAYFYSAWIGWTVTELFLHQFRRQTIVVWTLSEIG